jgi:hypothetical protein
MIDKAIFFHVLQKNKEDRLLQKLKGEDSNNINLTLAFANDSDPKRRIYPAFKLFGFRSDVFISLNSNLLFYAGYTSNIVSTNFFKQDEIIENMPEELHFQTGMRKNMTPQKQAPYASWPKYTLSQFHAKIIKRSEKHENSDHEFLISNQEGSVVKSKIKSRPPLLLDGIQTHNEVHARATIASVDSVIINKDYIIENRAIEEDQLAIFISAINLQNRINKERSDICEDFVNYRPNNILNYCVDIEILKMTIAFQKIILLKLIMESNKINQSVDTNLEMKSSFFSKSIKMKLDFSSFHHQQNYTDWIDLQKEKMDKTIEEILAEIKDRGQLFKIDDNKLKELIEFSIPSPANREILHQEYQNAKERIKEWKESKEKNTELRKALEGEVFEELQKKVKIKSYSMESTTLKLEEVVIANDFCKNFIDDDKLKAELKNFSDLLGNAIKSSDFTMVKFLIENEIILGNKYSNKGADDLLNIEIIMQILKVDGSKQALFFAIEKGSPNVVEYFLNDEEAYSDENKIACFEFAIQNEQSAVMEILLKKEKSLVGDRYISDLLKLAVKKNSHEAIKFLLAKENNIDLSEEVSPNLVNWAIKNGHNEVTKFLLKREHNSGIQRSDDLDLLRFAIENENVEIVKFLLIKERDPESFYENSEDSDANSRSKEVLSSIIYGMHHRENIHQKAIAPSKDKKFETLASALNQSSEKIKKLDLSSCYKSSWERESEAGKNLAIAKFNDNIKCFFGKLKLPNLEELDLVDNKLNSESINLISEISPNIIRLNLAGCIFFKGRFSVKNLTFPKIKDLDFSRNNIVFNNNFTAFINWLRNSETLEKLNLSDNPAENNAESFCKIIAQNKLIELNISNNKIDDNGIKKIATSLVKNSKLQKLDLSGNNITPAGFEALLEVLKKNENLQSFGDIETTPDIEQILKRNRDRQAKKLLGDEDLDSEGNKIQGGDGAPLANVGSSKVGARSDGIRSQSFNVSRGEGYQKRKLLATPSKEPSAILKKRAKGVTNVKSSAQSQSYSGPT